MTSRPEWCPHPTCTPQMVTQDCACGGVLPESEPHGPGTNEYRLCLRNSLETDDPWTFDLQVNDSDLFGLRRIFHALDGKHNPWGTR